VCVYQSIYLYIIPASPLPRHYLHHCHYLPPPPAILTYSPPPAVHFSATTDGPIGELGPRWLGLHPWLLAQLAHEVLPRHHRHITNVTSSLTRHHLHVTIATPSPPPVYFPSRNSRTVIIEIHVCLFVRVLHTHTHNQPITALEW
jgi:hypothetical protein